MDDGSRRIGFGIVIVPVTPAPSRVSRPRAPAWRPRRQPRAAELGAVAGVAILGSIVNGQLTVNLTARLVSWASRRLFDNWSLRR